jgi:hypothetical protein
MWLTNLDDELSNILGQKGGSDLHFEIPRNIRNGTERNVKGQKNYKSSKTR